MSHKCHAYKCDKQTNPKMFMCSLHWSALPTILQVPIRTHFNPMQCTSDKAKRVRPSAEWMKAAREAINYISKREGNFIEKKSEG